MSVRPILLQKDGAIKGIPGAYRNSPPPISGMYTGSGALINVTYYTVNVSGEAELVTVKAYPFYVDSISGGLDTSGDGTPGSPWRSVNYALAQIQPILTCLNSTSCCTYLVLRIKGTVDYTVQYNGGSTFNGYNRFIIEPYEDESINVAATMPGYPILNMRGTIIKDMIIDSDISTDGAVHNIYGAIQCIFNRLKIDTKINTGGRNGTIDAFSMGSNIIMYDCSIYMIDEHNGGWAFFGINSPYSIFHTVNIDIYENYMSNGFYSCHNSVFRNCDSIIHELESPTSACGFFGNTNSIFFNCIGTSLNRTDCDI